MHPVKALVRLFGPLAKYYTTPGRILPDGSPPPMGDHTPVDHRDQDAICEAGRYLRAMTIMEQASQGGTRYRAILAAYYTREGVALHRTRMEMAIDELARSGFVISGRKFKSKSDRVEMFTELLQEAITSYGRALRRT